MNFKPQNYLSEADLINLDLYEELGLIRLLEKYLTIGSNKLLQQIIQMIKQY